MIHRYNDFLIENMITDLKTKYVEKEKSIEKQNL